MSDIAKLLEAIAALLWPLFAFTLILLFRKQIAELVARLRRGKLLGQEIELNESLDKLDRSALAVEKEVAALPSPTAEAPAESTQTEHIIKDIISEATRSPKAALILLASEIEKEARQLLASVGRLKARTYVPLSQAIAELDKQYGGLPGHVQSALKSFWEARNKLIHGGDAAPEDILRAVDSGVTILKALQALPREVNVVHHPGVDVFEDSSCEYTIPNVKGVILETEAPGGTKKMFRIFPTTKTHFQKGKRVAWEWNDKLRWGPAWYRSPDNGQIKQAWSSSMEFIGRNLDEV